MAEITNPLAWNVPIVDPQGLPTREFLLKWAQQTRINSGIPALSTSAQVSAVLDIIGNGVGSLLVRTNVGWVAYAPGTANFVLTANGAGTPPTWQALPAFPDIETLLDSISNVRGSVLYRGAAGWAALAPGTSGDVLTTGGVGADPAWAAGGGGSNVVETWPAVMSSNDTGAFATLADLLVPRVSVSVSSILAAFNNATIGNTYNAFIATVNPTTGAITGTVATGTAFTTLATGFQTRAFAITPVTLNAGTAYIIALVITSGTGTSSCRAVGPNATSGWPNFPLDVGAMLRGIGGSGSVRLWYAQNSAAPTSVAISGSGSGTYGLGLRWQ